MMNKKYYKNLNVKNLDKLKTELRKIKLSLVSDLQQAVEQMEQLSEEIEGNGKEFDKLAERINADGEDMMQLFRYVRPATEEVKKSLKDLGLNENDVPAIKQAEKIMDKAITLSKNYQFA